MKGRGQRIYLRASLSFGPVDDASGDVILSMSFGLRKNFEHIQWDNVDIVVSPISGCCSTVAVGVAVVSAVSRFPSLIDETEVPR